MNDNIRLIKKFAKSKKNWNLTEVDLLYNVYRLNKFGAQSDKPLEPGDIVVFTDNEYYTGYYKILYRLPHGGEKSYEIQPFLQGEDEEVDTLNAYVSEIQRVDPKKQEELEAKALETKAQKAPEKQSAPSYRGDVYSASRRLF
uniref:Uncharacterized protein n=1 Tax=viral metagenome TaxID=1070528 RepID=A0A6C0F9W3_9ZZZZ|tara:strand:+ start:4779 stop:5207 length:429 start_codon:yes stop_codon:yes gene_type:complete